MVNVGAMGRSKTDEITPLQREILDEICRHIDAKRYPPTVKGLRETFGISHSSVHERINQLVCKGYLKREGRNNREPRGTSGNFSAMLATQAGEIHG